MLNRSSLPRGQAGTTLLEVLVTITILAFGLLGLAGFQLKTQAVEMESYQRAQALILIGDMVERIKANQANATAYVTTSTLGNGDTQPASCANLAVGVARDQCEWSNALKGAAEVTGGNKVGAMIGAVGCIEQTQAQDLGNCVPASFRVTLAWQGLNPTVAPPAAITCGQGLYGSENRRRVVSAPVTIGLLRCP